MAPTPSPIHVYTSNPPAGRHLHRLRRQALSSSHHPPAQSSALHTEQSKPRILDAVLQPSVVPEGLPPSPVASIASFKSAVLTPEASGIPFKDGQPQGPNPPEDIPGNIVAAVIVIMLIMGGLIGLIVGGEMLRKRAKTTGERTSPPGRRKSEPTNSTIESPQQRSKTSHQKLPYDAKTLNSLTRPPPVFKRERQRRFSDVWPIRTLSRALCNRRVRPAQVEHSAQHSAPVANPQTTWSDFSPASLYVAPTRTVLPRIPEEIEDCQSQTDIAAILGVTLQRSSESGSVVSIPQTKQPKWSHTMHAEDANGSGSSMKTGSKNYQNIPESDTRNDDVKSLGSSAPDMISDGGESSRSSMASLESLREQVFELRRAQTRSMQMNKGILLSLSLKTMNDSENFGVTHGELGCGPSPSAPDAGGKNHVEPEMTLAMLGEGFSAVDLDEFPSPPSILPVIPSFVSGFRCD